MGRATRDDDASAARDRGAGPPRLPLPDALLPRPAPVDEPPDTPVTPHGDDNAASRTRRWTWFAALGVFVVTLAVPLLAIAAATDEAPEIRVLPTDGRVSALIASDAVRVLVLNSTDPRTARSVLGAARPWEPAPQLVISPADDAAAIGLLAVVRATTVQSVIVAGLPGANAVWHALDGECRSRGIDLAYTAGSMRVAVGATSLTVLGIDPDTDGGAAVVVRRDDGGATVTIALDREVPTVRTHALVTSGPGIAANAELIVTTSDDARRTTHNELVLGFGDRATLVLERDEIAAYGGTFRRQAEADTE